MRKPLKIYFASPLFNQMEKTFNKSIVNNIRYKFKDKVSIYLPQENEAINDKSGYADSKMIAIGDNKELLDADLLIAVLDGQTIDNGVASEIGIAYSLGIPTVGLYTDTRQGTFGNEEKIRALDTIAESQFSYINLYTVGLIKSTNEVHQNALENNGIYNDIRGLYNAIQYFIDLRKSVINLVSNNKHDYFNLTAVSMKTGVKFTTINPQDFGYSTTEQLEQFITDVSVSEDIGIDDIEKYKNHIQYQLLLNQRISLNSLFGHALGNEKYARMIIRNIGNIYNSYLLGNYSKEHYINKQLSFNATKYYGYKSKKADKREEKEYYVDGFHYNNDGTLKTNKVYRFKVTKEQYDKIVADKNIFVPDINGNRKTLFLVLHKGVLNPTMLQPKTSIMGVPEKY